MTVAIDLDKASLPNDGVAEEDSVPPILESFIPETCLPDVIDVDVDYARFYGMYGNEDLWERVAARHAIKFVRQYPPRTLTNEVNGSKSRPDGDSPKREVLTGQLDLQRPSLLGVGSHSKVVLAPLTIPSTQSVRRAVAVKVSLPNYNSHTKSRKMLLNEAKIYNAFPRELQAGNNPVVPKFYGYYVPSTEAFECDDNGNEGGSDDDTDNFDEKEWNTVRSMLDVISPILLLEACGKDVQSHYLSDKDRTEIEGLLRRLHGANFVQGSMFERNILVQPGPLNRPCANRTLDNPSYRIVDFGRGKGFGVNSSSLEGMRDEGKEERQNALYERLIPYKHT